MIIIWINKHPETDLQLQYVLTNMHMLKWGLSSIMF